MKYQFRIEWHHRGDFTNRQMSIVETTHSKQAVWEFARQMWQINDYLPVIDIVSVVPINPEPHTLPVKRHANGTVCIDPEACTEFDNPKLDIDHKHGLTGYDVHGNTTEITYYNHPSDGTCSWEQ